METAVNTVKSSEAASLGIPEPIFKPAASIVYVKAIHTRRGTRKQAATVIVKEVKGGVITASTNPCTIAHSSSSTSQSHIYFKKRRKNNFISSFFNKAAENFYNLNNNLKISSSSFYKQIAKPVAILNKSTKIIQKAGASLCTSRFTEEPDDDARAIWDGFGSAELDRNWVYEIIPPEIIEPVPIPDWYINFVSSEQEIEKRLDDLISGEVQPPIPPQPSPKLPPVIAIHQPESIDPAKLPTYHRPETPIELFNK